jgi:hypothetical protein
MASRNISDGLVFSRDGFHPRRIRFDGSAIRSKGFFERKRPDVWPVVHQILKSANRFRPVRLVTSQDPPLDIFRDTGSCEMPFAALPIGVSMVSVVSRRHEGLDRLPDRQGGGCPTVTIAVFPAFGKDRRSPAHRPFLAIVARAGDEAACAIHFRKCVRLGIKKPFDRI